MDLKIFEIIKNNKEFDELPFIVVFKTLQILEEKQLLRTEEKDGLGTVSVIAPLGRFPRRRANLGKMLIPELLFKAS